MRKRVNVGLRHPGWFGESERWEVDFAGQHASAQMVPGAPLLAMHDERRNADKEEDDAKDDEEEGPECGIVIWGASVEGRVHTNVVCGCELLEEQI